MKIYFTFILILYFSISALSSKAQNRLMGVIKDAQSNKALQAAKVNIPDLNIYAVSDSLGRYAIENIPAGTYLVEIGVAGYETKIETVSIKGYTKKNFQLDQSLTELKEVIVTGVISATDKQKNPVPVVTMSFYDLLQNSSTNVIDAIAATPGVSAITDGQSISKPVIRGLGYNRVLTVNDGVEQVDQPWFDEFGIEADPDAVNRYEILKGPASLSYGSDAIAGVVNLIPEQPLPEGQTKADILFDYQTNNGLINNMLHITSTQNGISWSARVDNIMAHAYQDPYDGYVLNSQFSNFNIDGTIGIHRSWGYTQIHASYFDMHTGIVDGTRDSLSGLMERQVAYPGLNGGAATYVLPTHQEEVSYTPFVIDQRIQHTKVVWDNSIATGNGRVK